MNLHTLVSSLPNMYIFDCLKEIVRNPTQKREAHVVILQYQPLCMYATNDTIVLIFKHSHKLLV